MLANLSSTTPFTPKIAFFHLKFSKNFTVLCLVLKNKIDSGQSLNTVFLFWSVLSSSKLESSSEIRMPKNFWSKIFSSQNPNENFQFFKNHFFEVKMTSKRDVTVPWILTSDASGPDQPPSCDVITICPANGLKIFTSQQFSKKIGQICFDAPAHHKQLLSQKFICTLRTPKAKWINFCNSIALELFEHRPKNPKNRFSAPKFWKFWASFSTIKSIHENQKILFFCFDKIYMPVASICI